MKNLWFLLSSAQFSLAERFTPTGCWAAPIGLLFILAGWILIGIIGLRRSA